MRARIASQRRALWLLVTAGRTSSEQSARAHQWMRRERRCHEGRHVQRFWLWARLGRAGRLAAGAPAGQAEAGPQQRQAADAADDAGDDDAGARRQAAADGRAGVGACARQGMRTISVRSSHNSLLPAVF